MSDNITLLALAERCEQAAGPDAGLDLAIWTTLLDTPGFQPPSPWRTDYTASIDAAVTLVPEGHEWLRKNPESMTVYRVPGDLKEWAQHIYGRGATDALALCAAALRARAAAHD
jgi:hypothetical protein